MTRRRQGSPCTNGNNTSDSEESKGSPKNNANSCKDCGQNLLKGINLKKILKVTFISEVLTSAHCKQCKQLEEVTPDQGLYMCLQCGTLSCDDKDKKHDVQHYSCSRSDPHFIGLHLKEWKYHCFKCNEEVDSDQQKKLMDALIFIKAQSAKIEKSLVVVSNAKEVNNVSEEDTSPSLQKKKLSNSSYFNQSKPRQFSNQKMLRVRGLANLGNTCFFNSVLQCLAQTPFLLDLLSEIQDPDEEFILPAKDGEESMKLTLSKWGPLTEALANTLAEITTGDYSAFQPRKLLDALRQKCPQFEGYDQHDSHELLRHLLECVRLEDLRRYQKEILRLNGLTSKIDPQAVDKETGEVLKKMNQRIQDTVPLRPEHLFRGTLVSTLTCKSCNHVSDTEERFLDLSLPIAGEKPQPVRKRTKARCNVGGRCNSSKQKEKRKNLSIYSSQPSPENGQGDSCSPKKQDESDGAEVEDNEDSKKADGESGYSSEKPGSTRVSPVPTPDTTPENMCSVTDNSLNSEYSPENSVNMYENGSVGASVPIESTAGCGSPDSICANASPGSPMGFEDPHSTGVDANSVKSKLSSLDSSPDYLPLFGSEYNNQKHSNLGSITEFCEKRVSSENYDRPSMDNLDSYSAPENNDNDIDNDNDNINDRTITTNDANAQNSASLDTVCSEFYMLINGPNKEGASTSHNSNAGSPVSNPPESEEEDDDSTVGHSSGFISYSSRYQNNDSELSVTSCLNQFTALESLSGSNQVSCENCVKIQTKGNKGKTEKAVYSNATKQFLIRSPPAVLILHLKRFQVLYTSFQKIHRNVSFPLLLDIDPYCSDKCREECRTPGKKEILYSLYGVVVHSGSLGGGHYIAYVKARDPPGPDDERLKFVQGLKNPFKKEKEEDVNNEDKEKEQNGVTEDQEQNHSNQGSMWYYISDSHVRQVSESDVLKCEAYLLFYERIV